MYTYIIVTNITVDLLIVLHFFEVHIMYQESFTHGERALRQAAEHALVLRVPVE